MTMRRIVDNDATQCLEAVVDGRVVASISSEIVDQLTTTDGANWVPFFLNTGPWAPTPEDAHDLT